MTAFWESLKDFRDLPPLVAPDDTWTLWAIILVGVAGSIYLEQTYRWAAKVSGPVLALVAAMVNLAVTLVLGKLLRLNLEELLMCVNATLGGPPRLPPWRSPKAGRSWCCPGSWWASGAT